MSPTTSNQSKRPSGGKGVSSKRQAALRAKAEKLRKAEQARKRRQRLFGISAAVVVVLVVVGGVAYAVHRNSSGSAGSSAVNASQQIIPASVTGQTTVQNKPAQVTNTTGVKGVLAFDTLGYPAAGKADSGTLAHEHVTGPVTYAVTPPVGGPHSATWMNAGVYTKPIPNERAVHSLEHGAVWITYDPDLPAAQVKQLVALVNKQSYVDESSAGTTGQANRFVDLSPWASNSLPSKIVISSWGYQLRVSSPTDSRLQQFVDTFRHAQKYAPEYGSSVDGIPVQTGGRPAADGSKIANPAGSAN